MKEKILVGVASSLITAALLALISCLNPSLILEKMDGVVVKERKITTWSGQCFEPVTERPRVYSTAVAEYKANSMQGGHLAGS